MSARRMTFFRPKLSPSRPLAGEMARANRDVQAVMRDLSRVVRRRFERDVLTDTRVAEMTPVSSTKMLVQLQPLTGRYRGLHMTYNRRSGR